MDRTLFQRSKRRRSSQDSTHSRTKRKRTGRGNLDAYKDAVLRCLKLVSETQKKYLQHDKELHLMLGVIRHLETQLQVSRLSKRCTLCWREFGCDVELEKWENQYIHRIDKTTAIMLNSELIDEYNKCRHILECAGIKGRTKLMRIKDLLAGRVKALATQGLISIESTTCMVCQKRMSAQEVKDFEKCLKRRLDFLVRKL